MHKTNRKAATLLAILLIAAIILPGTVPAKAEDETTGATLVKAKELTGRMHTVETKVPVEAKEPTDEPEEQEPPVPVLPDVALEASEIKQGMFSEVHDETLRSIKEAKFAERLQQEYEYYYQLYLKDRNLLAEVIYYENYWTGKTWEERLRAMLLTGSVVLNRVADPDYPDTIEGVLYEKGQYATTPYFFTKELPDEVYEIADQLLREGPICPANVVYQARFHQGSDDYDEIAGEWFCYK